MQLQLILEQTPPARARRSDPQTSKQAAAKVDVRRRETQVLDCLKAWPAGLTSVEIAERTGLELVTVSPRMKPLEGKGCVKRAGKKDGRTIWQATR